MATTILDLLEKTIDFAMKQTPLYDVHVAQGGKIVDFAGWAMPLQYSGVLDEYHAVRNTAGLFDVSHMGRIQVEGLDAVAYLQRVATNDIEKIDPLNSQYSMLCNPEGGVKDDIFIYRLSQNKFLLCVNGSNREKIFDWLRQQQNTQKENVQVEDRSASMSQFALQGPAAKAIMQQELGPELEGLKPRQFKEAALCGALCIISRTGYTGERGYELYIPVEQAVAIWQQLVAIGEAHGLKPAGLGARDLLRLDMGYFLYGNDLTEEITPIEAGAEWVVNWDKGPFVGREILQRQKEQGSSKRLVGFELLEKAVPRHGMKLLADGMEIGEISSGNLSPILQKGIGLGYVLPAYAELGTRIEVEIRGRRVPAQVVKFPFYKKPKPSA
ncbi:glycine cleavage system aminomethyltransferase GcvT [Candidatus Nitronereus thalassa]|uniref:Aminomethyltransferase n=1 Tax=Candidatus Nitronereus thalassa TaxID=3020898 RepID=A0ABU3K7N0_9BACT|nr:glycine cleavage system aminomethyltransferase GcvT [Candidatus Nitronereus thalassa]MDT7042449.1 glycine cleavage system aminomethyltransferase GcvT [Candidatus Nitronereus thalassa]